MSGTVLLATLRVLVLWAAGLVAAGQFAKIAVILPHLAEVYPGRGAALGLLLTLISLLGVVFGMTAGVIAARAGLRRTLIAALAGGAALSAVQAMLPGFGWMLASRVVEGAAHLAVVVAAPTLIAQIAGPRGQPAALSLWSTFFAVAFALAAWGAPPLIAAHGPAGVLRTHAALSAAAALAVALAVPRSLGAPVATATRGAPSLAVESVRAYAARGAAVPAAGWVFYTLVFVAVLTLMPPDLPAGHRAAVAAAMPLAGVAVSLGLGVPLMRRMSAVRVVMLGFGLSLATCLPLALLPGTAGPAIGLFAALGLVQGATFAAVPQLNTGAAARARANGALAQAGNLGNLAGTPLLIAATAAAGPMAMPAFVALACAAGLAVYVLAAPLDARRQAGYMSAGD